MLERLFEDITPNGERWLLLDLGCWLLCACGEPQLNELGTARRLRGVGKRRLGHGTLIGSQLQVGFDFALWRRTANCLEVDDDDAALLVELDPVDPSSQSNLATANGQQRFKRCLTTNQLTTSLCAVPVDKTLESS
jgi:hypothetical protein